MVTSNKCSISFVYNMNYLNLLRKYGIKNVFLAKKTGIPESLLRFHFKRKEKINPDVELTVFRAIKSAYTALLVEVESLLKLKESK